LQNSKTELHTIDKGFCDFFIISTDASSSGVGAIFHTPEGDNLISRADLPDFLIGSSSTIRELYGILNAIKSFKSLITEEKVQIQTDSQTAQSVFYKGSTKTEIQCIVAQIWETIDYLKCEVEVFWIPRGLNVQADWASRIVNLDDGLPKAVQPSMHSVTPLPCSGPNVIAGSADTCSTSKWGLLTLLSKTATPLQMFGKV
ncbi:hypothetical protein ANCCAN_21073, partial [Ancylostoma caninum]